MFKALAAAVGLLKLEEPKAGKRPKPKPRPRPKGGSYRTPVVVGEDGARVRRYVGLDPVQNRRARQRRRGLLTPTAANPRSYKT